MNIFEQYGGYEVVKQAISNYKQSGDLVTAAGLELQCLEYRRKHNIFEDGDLVVKKSGKHWNQVFKVHNSNEKITTIQAHVLVMFETRFLRHATDAEIAAGRRL